MSNAREIIALEIDVARDRDEELPPSDAEHVVVATVTITAA
jgi:hypothetical protein